MIRMLVLAWIGVCITAWAAPGDDLKFGGSQGRAMVGALLTAGVEARATDVAGVYEYTVSDMVCKTSNHGGPQDYGITYLVGCEQDAKFTETNDGYGSGKRFHDSEGVMKLVEQAAGDRRNGSDLGDCAMGKCFFYLKKLRCTVDTRKGADSGCSCVVTPRPPM
jgi:hypothetical protein